MWYCLKAGTWPLIHAQQCSDTSLETVILLNSWRGMYLGRWRQVSTEINIPHLLGTVLALTRSEIRSLFPADDDYFAYFDPGLAESCREAVDNLEKYIDLEGPFDGILAFSQGASLAATLMTKTATGELTKPLGPPFSCAIFLSAAMPMNYAALLDGQVEELSLGSLGEVITTPTAHIWGRNDREYGGMSDGLSKLCKKEFKAEFVHQGGHEVPSSGSEDSVIGAVNAIRRTIARALTVQ